MFFEDLLQSFLEDLYLNDDEKARVARKKHFGFEHSLTGDMLVDKWLEQLSKGETPDLSFGEDERSRKRSDLIKRAAKEFTERTGFKIFKARYYDPIRKEWINPNMYAAGAGYDEEGSAKDPLEIDFSEGDALQGSLTGEMADNVPIEAFDELVNAMGAIRRE